MERPPEWKDASPHSGGRVPPVLSFGDTIASISSVCFSHKIAFEPMEDRCVDCRQFNRFKCNASDNEKGGHIA